MRIHHIGYLWVLLLGLLVGAYTEYRTRDVSNLSLHFNPPPISLSPDHKYLIAIDKCPDKDFVMKDMQMIFPKPQKSCTMDLYMRDIREGGQSAKK